MAAPVEGAVRTGVKGNANFAKLQAGYLFPEVGLARNVGCSLCLQSPRYVHPQQQSCSISCVFKIAKRRREHQEQYPDAKIISLGIGDTTEPIPQYIADAMSAAAAGMATREGYSGYRVLLGLP